MFAPQTSSSWQDSSRLKKKLSCKFKDMCNNASWSMFYYLLEFAKSQNHYILNKNVQYLLICVGNCSIRLPILVFTCLTRLWRDIWQVANRRGCWNRFHLWLSFVVCWAITMSSSRIHKLAISRSQLGGSSLRFTAAAIARRDGQRILRPNMLQFTFSQSADEI